MLVTEVYAVADSLELTPLFSCPVSAGFPSPADDYVEVDLNLHAHLVENPPATFFVRARGTSMIGAGIQDNDLLIVDRSLEPKDGSIIVANVDGDLTVKTYSCRGGNLRLVAQNPDQPPIPIGPETEVNVWGVVTSVIHQFVK